MPQYIDVVRATTETATKILARRSKNGAHRVETTVNGGTTASVVWFPGIQGTNVKLHMPTLPPDTVFTRAEADRLVAYIAHECCHVLHTDKLAWERAIAFGPRVRLWTNALEDVRIEAKEIRAGAFPALRDLLASLMSQKHFEALCEAEKQKRNIGQELANAPYVSCVLGRVANKYNIPTARGLAQSLSPEVRQLVDVALAGLPQCKTSWDVVTLARRLADMQDALRPPPVPQPPQTPQTPPDDQNDQNGDGDRDDAGDRDGDGDQDDQDGDGNQDGDDSQDANGGRNDGIEPDQDLDDMVRTLAKRNGIDDVEKNAKEDNSSALNVARITHDTAPRASNYDNTNAADVLNGLMPTNSVLHGQIGRLLVSDEVRRRTHHETSGRLDRRALVRMRTGAPDVFSQRDDQPGIDTALIVLVDGSSSMYQTATGNLSRMRLAQIAAWQISRAAEMANAKVAVVMFQSWIVGNGRIDNGARIITVKPWDARTEDCARAILSMDPIAYTPLSHGIVAAADMLTDVTATRRIILALTDGECDLQASGVRAACRLADNMGVEVAGIGMDCQSVTDAFPPRYSVNVTDLTHLATTGLGVLTDMLEDANPRGAD